MENLIHPDNGIFTGHLTEDKSSPLYKYNNVHINALYLEKWEHRQEFINNLKNLDESGKWKGKYLKALIENLSRPAKQSFDIPPNLRM